MEIVEHHQIVDRRWRHLSCLMVRRWTKTTDICVLVDSCLPPLFLIQVPSRSSNGHETTEKYGFGALMCIGESINIEFEEFNKLHVLKMFYFFESVIKSSFYDLI